MSNPKEEDWAILFQNQDKTVFLIDIPQSIALAQELSPGPSTPKHENPSPTKSSALAKGKIQPKKYLVSAPARQIPFPSTEPGTESARARVLETIPVSERRFHGEFIQPLVRSALQDIQAAFQSEERQWSLPRRVLDGGRGGQRKLEQGSSSQQRTLHARDTASQTMLGGNVRVASEMTGPPVILSSNSVNAFEALSDLDGIVKNPSSESAILKIGPSESNGLDDSSEYMVPPRSVFVLCTLPLTESSLENPIPGIPTSQKFNLILFDPPWPNRSVRRSSHYETHPYAEMELLTSRLRDILRAHSYIQPDHSSTGPLRARDSTCNEQQAQSQESMAAIWITNSEKARRTAYEALTTTGFRISEEWIWIKTTAIGQPISPLDGLWRRPYEILVIGRKNESYVDAGDKSQCQETDLLGIDPSSIKRRVLAAVPDLHSRKPNLKAVFEEVFFQSSSSEHAVESYSALEVFARNLTAGWWASGNEVLKFNARECWIEEDTYT